MKLGLQNLFRTVFASQLIAAKVKESPDLIFNPIFVSRMSRSANVENETCCDQIVVLQADPVRKNGKNRLPCGRLLLKMADPVRKGSSNCVDEQTRLRALVVWCGLTRESAL